MKDGIKNIIAASILAFGLILASIIYAFSNRYEISRTEGTQPMRIDKWKNEWVGVERTEPMPLKR